MSELTISSTNWLAISLRNGTAIIFNLNNPEQWQYLNNNESQEKFEDDLNRNLIKFTPNGQKLVINGQNKQIYIYIPSDYQTTKIYWELQRIITVKKRASAIDLTNDILFIADKSGDVYKTDLSNQTNLILTDDDCIMGHLSMLLDIMFIRLKENQEFLLTADRDEKIRLSHYPNCYNIQGYCLGHTEFVSHIKLINENQILSASGDGTLRLWDLPDCVELKNFQTKTIISSSKEIFYGELESNLKENENSSLNDSIWKIDVLLSSSSSDIFIALSIYASRNHSIYLINLSKNESYKLIFNSTYGSIIDYCFSSNLYILFDNNTLQTVNIKSIFENDKIEISQENKLISKILSTKEYNLVNNINTLEIIFKQLFKTRGEPGDCSYYKRKNERIEQQEEKKRKKQNSGRCQSPNS